MLFNGGKPAGRMRIDRRFMVMKNMSLGDCLPLSRGYIHVYDHNIQTSSWPIKAKNLSGASLGKGNKSEYKWSSSQNKEAAMAINSKNLYKFYCSEPEDL